LFGADVVVNPVIKFYETDKPYGCFSNFSAHPVIIDGTRWPTTEHFFQAMKFTDQRDVDAVAAALTPFEAAQKGRDRTRSFRGDWDTVRDDVMLKALRAKFVQHDALADVLRSTGDAALVEHTRNDSYWADGGDGRGLNRLGDLLGIVRGALPPWPVPFCPPPWVMHPDIEVSDMFWRMGGGQGLLVAGSDFRRSLSGLALDSFDAYFPVPDAWRHSW
jgi:ribA/ribD-fused uncharacterized protein